MGICIRSSELEDCESYPSPTKNIPKMLRFICGLLLVASAMANEQQYQQYQQAQAMDPMMARQGLGASANLGFGDFGSFGAQGNVNLPSYGQDNSLLTTILIGVGLITLFNTIVTVDDTEEATPEARMRRQRQIDALKGYVMQGIHAVASKYQLTSNPTILSVPKSSRIFFEANQLISQ